MSTFRSTATDAAYTQHRQNHTISSETTCDLCDKASLHEFTLWRIVPNDFPYDEIVEVHHMLIPKRHAKETDLTDEERKEFLDIKRGYVQEHYDFVMETTHRSKSIPHHYHPHLWRRFKDS